MENDPALIGREQFRSARIKIEADVIEPLGNQILVAGIEHIRVIQQQHRGPVHKIALGYELKPLAFQRIRNMFPGNDDAGLRDWKPVVCRAALGGSRFALPISL